MKKITSLLIAALIIIPASGVLEASDFEKSIKNIETDLALIKVTPQLIVPSPARPAAAARWWSMIWSAHKAIMKAALSFIDKTEFPDIGRASDDLKTGGNDESGHADSKANGGRPEDLWYGKKPGTKGGVLYNYEQFISSAAYERLGVICHLTQDMAVPTHAANIKHSIDSFEAWPDNKVTITASRDEGEMEPYAYYQDVQDETRKQLTQWVNPGTMIPYWVSADNAPPLGQDATFGPWGHYGGDGHDHYAGPPWGTNSSQWGTASPEIRFRQLAVAGAATVAVFKSASKRLPPLVKNLSVSAVSARHAIKFSAFDNRSRQLEYTVLVYKDGALIGEAVKGEAPLAAPASGEIMLSGEVAVEWDGTVNSEALPAGSYVLEVRLTDGDGNMTPDEVNADSNPANDTRTALTIN